MKQKIRPAEEEIGNVAFIFLFVILWYSALLGSVMSGGAGITVMLFFVAGLLPVYSAVTMIRRALFYRKQRADAIAYGQSQPGRIQGVVRQDVPYYSGKNRTLRYHRSGDRCDQHDTESGVSQADSSLSCFGTGARLYRQERLEILSGRLSV